MRKFLLLLSMCVLSLSSFAQVKSYPPLEEEDVDYASIKDQNYLMYKLSTTMPLTSKKELESKYFIKNFDWGMVLKNDSKLAQQLATILIDSLTIREPLAEEEPNYLYLHAKIPSSKLPFVLRTKITADLETLKNGSYKIHSVKNLYDLGFILTPKLLNEKNENLLLGEKCIVTVSDAHGTDEVEFTFAFAMKGASFNDIASGNVELSIGGITVPEMAVIRKSDVGKMVRFHSRDFDVLAFDKGVLHLRYLKRFADSFKEYKYIGNINGERFSIKCPYNTVLYPAYEKYRNKPKLNYEDFVKYDTPKSKINIDVRDLDYDVAIFNFGYDIDYLNVYIEKKLLPTKLISAISVRKQDNKYTFVPIMKKTPKEMDPKIIEDLILIVREYFRKNVVYPTYAQAKNISGIVRFKLGITPEGTITELEIISSPDRSLSEEVRRIAARARFDFSLPQTFYGHMSLSFKL